MKMTITPGRLFYAVAMIACGTEHFIFGDFPVALLPVPANIPARPLWVSLAGGVFVAAGIGVFLKKIQSAVAMILGALWLLLLLVAHLPRIITSPFNPQLWTAAMEVAALGGGAFILASVSSHVPGVHEGRLMRTKIPALGRYLFASSLAVFGVQHFMYADFISMLISAWMPGKLFWAYFVGIAFLATSLSLFWGKQVRLSTALLGGMFLLWVLLLHLPRAVASPRSQPEWSSTFIALAMSGIGFMLFGYRGKSELMTQKTYLAPAE